MREQVQQAVMAGWETPTWERGIGSNDQHDGLRRFPPASPSEWIGEIQRQFTQGRSATLVLAITVSTAKSRLQFGEWTAILKSGRLPFRKRKAEMLFVIGNGLGWLSAHARAQLPSAFRTLYCLARIERATLEALITDGAIHPALSLRDAKELVAKFCGQKMENRTKVNVKWRLRRFRDFVCNTLNDWTPDDRALAITELPRLIEHIHAASETSLAAKAATVLPIDFSFPAAGQLLTKPENAK